MTIDRVKEENKVEKEFLLNGLFITAAAYHPFEWVHIPFKTKTNIEIMYNA